ncbi:MAG: prepilin-type N-terminal cleavage/methylation domain-containing protein [Candidatus Saccharimonadales bacterium]
MKRRSLHDPHAGFTLVELLVVVVVIVILATIGMVAYDDAKKRAYNAQITQGVAQYLKAIQTYRGLNGTYPKVSSETGALNAVSLTCLGKGYPGASCGTVAGVEVHEDAGFNTAIADVIGDTIPSIGKEALSVSGEIFIGAVYGIDQIDPVKYSGAMYGRVINYALLGADADCTVAESYSYSIATTKPATTACEIYIDAK